jgi:hypothetical protein
MTLSPYPTKERYQMLAFGKFWFIIDDAGIPECRAGVPTRGQARFWLDGVEASATRIFEKKWQLATVFQNSGYENPGLEGYLAIPPPPSVIPTGAALRGGVEGPGFSRNPELLLCGSNVPDPWAGRLLTYPPPPVCHPDRSRSSRRSGGT